MEESEKRRERLRAMRMEAAAGAGVNADSDSSGLASAGLSNPLIEDSSPSASQYTSPRFDYYTDPMAAFSGRRKNITPQVSLGPYSTPASPVYQPMTPTPVYQSPGVNSPGQTIFQVPGTHFTQSPLQSPVAAFTPSGMPQGNPPNARGGSTFNYNIPPPHFSSPGFGRGNSPYVSYGSGRGQRFNSNPHYDSGRGRGRSLGNSMGPGSGLGGRRGVGSHGPVSAEQQPYLYYRKEMVEDPWKMLTPVVWKDPNSRDSDKSWLPKSISTKKAKVSGEASQISISQQSLAEYLAASFNDSTDEAVADENTT